MKKIAFIISLLLLFSSCTSAPQLISSNINSVGEYEELGENSCTGCSYVLLGLIPIGWGGMTSRAYHNLIDSKGGDDLINPEVTDSWYGTPAGYVKCVKIKGMVIKKVSK